MKVFFTHGSSSIYHGGWTMVDAADVTQAIALYRVFHPDRKPNYVDCAGIYSESHFKDTEYFRKGNLGKRAVEMISVNRMVAEEFKQDINTGLIE